MKNKSFCDLIKNNWFVIALILCLTGCMGNNIPPADIYTISPPELSRTSATGPDTVKRSILIKLAPIRAARAFAGTEILYSHNQYDLNSYAYSRWSDAPVRLMQTLFQVALTESGKYLTVLPSTSVSEADFVLESTLYDFSHHINVDGTSDGVIRIRFYLVDNRSKTVTATKEFGSRVPAPFCNARGAASALNKAVTDVADQLAAWLSEPGKLQ